MMNDNPNNIYNILRAKPKKERNYLLKDHLKETILRVIQLRDFINSNNSTIDFKFDDTFFENLIIACFLHDLGKINWKFQLRLFKKEEKEYDYENKKYKSNELNQLYNFFNSFRNIDIKNHEIISLIYSLIFLGNSDWEKKIRTAILFHHYNEFYSNRSNINFRYILDDYQDLENYLDFLIKNEDKIREILESFLKEISSINISVKNIAEKLQKNTNLTKIKDIKNSIENRHGTSAILSLFDISNKDDRSEDFYKFFVFLGCLRRCDYSASGNVEVEQVKALAENVYNNLTESIKKSIGENVGEIWQEKILTHYDAKNLILVAPTGSGKTEFALLWAKNRNKKLIYTLPLRVALNDLYWRFGKDRKYFNENNLAILHSTSFIEYLKECKGWGRASIEEMLSSSELFSTPVLLTTPDQVFLSSLKYYGFDKLLSVYPLSAIVIDEIQAYNPEMAAIIIKTLETIKKLGGNILIITATYPPYFKKFLDNFAKLIDIKDLIAAKKLEEKEVKNYALKRHKIKLINSSIFEYEKKNENYELKLNQSSFDKIVDIMKNNESKNIMIIVNNVGKAIKLYKEIKSKSKNVYLLHSRLIEKEKSRRIEEIKQKLKSNEKLILVATQIVEASVDVDFDILITEISPIDSQIQRWGRIYRNREKEGDYKDIEPNIIIFTGIDKGTSVIYDKRVTEKTIDILRKKEDEILDYEKEGELIENVFNEKINNLTLKEIYENEIEKNLEWLKYFSAEKRNEAQRIFRRIAGIQVVVPELMEKSNNEIEKAFYEVIKDKDNWNLSWEEIVERVKQNLNDEELKNRVNKWVLLKILYMYSFNLPIFSFGENYQLRYQILERENLKGFFVLKKEIIKAKKELEEYGLDKIKDIEIDNEEIKQVESFDNII